MKPPAALTLSITPTKKDNVVMELSTDNKAPGVLRIFGDSVRPGARYKSVLASFASTAIELVKEALCRYQIPDFKVEEFVLCEVIQKVNTQEDENSNPDVTLRGCEYVRSIDDHEKPLVLQELWRPIDGYTRRFEIRRKSDVLSLVQTDHVTTGLNSNARRIQISKVKRGVIPTDDKIESDISNNNTVNDNMNDVYIDRHSDLPRAPQQSPYLLTIRGYDTSKDKLFYPVIHDVCTVGGMANGRSSTSVTLNAPDVMFRHCSLTRRKLRNENSNDSHTIVEIQPEPEAKVYVNSWAIYSKIVLASGDLIAIGDHYLFIYKDLTKGMDIPSDLPWLHESHRSLTPRGDTGVDETDNSADVCRDNTLTLSNDQQFKPIRASVLSEIIKHPATSSSDNPMFRYLMDREDELILEILCAADIDNDTYKLVPSTLFAMCIEYSLYSFGLAHTNRLVSRMLSGLRENVLKCSSALSEESNNTSKNTERGREVDSIKPSMYWLSNCVQFYHFVNERVFSEESSYNEELHMQETMAVILRQFEEIIKFGFQQAVYSTTKVLYYVLPNMINIAYDEPSQSPAEVVRIVGDTWRLANEFVLNDHVTKQFITYIFFFINTSCFNKIINKERTSHFYTQSNGEKLRSALVKLLEWASEQGIKSEFDEMFAPYLDLVTMLSTSYDLLRQKSWVQMRESYSYLTEQQIFKFVNQYIVPDPLGIAPKWNPTDAERNAINDKDDVTLKLKDHPTFSVPSHGIVCIKDALADNGFDAKLQTLAADFAFSEDDDDSGYDAVPPPEQVAETQITTELGSPHSPKRAIQSNEISSTNQSTPSPNAIVNNIPIKPIRIVNNSNNKPHIETQLSYTSSEAGSDVSNIYVNTQQCVDYESNNPQNTNLKITIDKETTTTTISELNKPLLQIEESIETYSINSADLVSDTSSCNIVSKTTTPDIVSSTDVNVRGGVSTYCVGNGYYVSNQYTSPRHIQTPLDRTDSEVSAINKNAGKWDDIEYYSTVACCGCNGKGSVQHNDSATDDTMSDCSKPGDCGRNNTGSDLFRVEFSRGPNGLGLGLIDGLHTPLDKPGLFIRNLVDDGPAKQCGRLSVGDRLVAVNDGSLLDDDYFSAMDKIRNSGSHISLTVAKSTRHVREKIFSSLC